MQRIGLVVPDNFQMLSVAALAAFEFANKVTDGKAYDICVLSEAGGRVGSSLGMSLETRPMVGEDLDTVIFAGGNGIAPTAPAVIDFAKRSMDACRRVAAICSGTFVLAEAGILDGRRATTHWGGAMEMRRRFPKIKVDDDRIFVVDGPVWTSAGATAGIDLALGMVELDLGPEIARSAAKSLVVYHRRAGGQSQHSALLDIDAKSDRIQTALSYARQNLRAPLSVEELAGAANLSPRHFSRAFRAETGQPPAKAVENLRVEAARLMMEQSRHPIDFIAAETGFVDHARMRRAFLRAFGQPPQVFRRNARFDAAA
jgi:transcriptional regulator GlxA family with amidase domain